MVAVKDAAAEFLQARRIAVTGVSRTPGSHGGNAVFQGLRKRGFEVFAVNPNADQVEGGRSYHSISEIPNGVDAVVIAAAPGTAQGTVEECERLGIRKVWLHRSIGGGSVSQPAAQYARDHGLNVICGGCPLMFGADADRGHRMMRVVCTWTGAVPRKV
jgi:predicted CoA-binding protein